MLKTLVFPLIKKYRKLIASMIIVTALAVTLLLGLINGTESFENSFYSYVNDYNYPKILINIDEPEDCRDLSFINRCADVKNIETRLMAEAKCKKEDGTDFSLLMLEKKNQDYELAFIYELNESPDFPNISIDSDFAEALSLKAGDIIEVDMSGTKTKMCVGSIVCLPETITSVKDNYGNKKRNTGYGYFDSDLLTGTEYYSKANQILIYTEDNSDLYSVLEDIESSLEENGISVSYSYVFEKSPVKAFADLNIEPLKRMTWLIPSVFFLFMLLVLVLFQAQIIGQYRRGLSILRAIGFSNREVRLLFSRLALFIGISGVVLGVAGGVAIGKYCADFFVDYMSIPYSTYKINVPYSLASIAVTVIIGQIASLIACRKISSVMPVEAMRGESDSQGTKTNYRLPGKLSTDVRYSLILLLRNKKRFIFSCVCVGISIIMLIMAIECYCSLQEILDSSFFKTKDYDTQLFYYVEPDPLLFEDNEYVDDYEIIYVASSTVENEGVSESVTIYGTDSGSSLISIFDEKGRKLDVEYDGILLESYFADSLGVKAGDYVKVNGKDVIVSDISYQCAYKVQYVSKETMEQLFADHGYAVIIKSSDNSGCKEYFKSTDADSVVFKDELYASYKESLDTFDVALEIIICFAFVLGFFVVFNTIQTNLQESRKQLSMMRVLGFKISDINRQWSIHIILEYLFSCLFGFIAGKRVASFALDTMSDVSRSYPLVDKPAVYLIAGVTSALFIAFAYCSSIRSIKKWNIAEETKEKE